MQTSNKIVRTTKTTRTLKANGYRSEREKEHNRSSRQVKTNWNEEV